MKKEKLYTSWDECEIISEEIKYRLENKEYFHYDDNISEDDIRKDIYNSNFDFDVYFEDFINSLNELMSEITKRNYYKDGFKAIGKNIGWLNREGYKTFFAQNGTEFLRELLPNCDYTLYAYKNKNEIHIKLYHHDSPTGEDYYIKPLTKKEYNEVIKV